MSWTRNSSWNHPGQYQYDSADLPFSPHTTSEAGYLESGTPFWKFGNLTDDKLFGINSATSMGKDQPATPLVKLSTANSFSFENVSGLTSDNLSTPNSSLKVNDHSLVTQSLPATPLSTPAPTPYSTPAPTPFSTPAPTPQSSPVLQRKSEMEAVCKAALRCNQRLVQEQQSSQNMKWYYMGFLSNVADSCRPDALVSNSSKQLSTTAEKSPQNSTSKEVETIKFASIPSPSQDIGPQLCRRKCAPLLSNRDMNFFAPTSM